MGLRALLPGQAQFGNTIAVDLIEAGVAGLRGVFTVQCPVLIAAGQGRGRYQ